MLDISIINYLFSSSVLRRDFFILFNRIAILALQYSITLHVISLLMCSGYISKGKFLNRACSLILNKFFSFYFFFISIFVLQFLCCSPAKVLIYKIDFNIFLWYNLSTIYINLPPMINLSEFRLRQGRNSGLVLSKPRWNIYFSLGSFSSCFILGWIVAILLSILFFYIIGAYCCFILILDRIFALLLSTLFFYIIGAYGGFILLALVFSFYYYHRGNEEQLNFIKYPFQIPTYATHSMLLIYMFAKDGGGLGKIININKKLLYADQRNVIITLFLTYLPNRKCTTYKAWGLSCWRTFYCVKYARKRIYYPVSKCISRFQFFLLAHTSTRWARNYSTLGTPRRSVENFQLDPLWVTGFIDGEGCFLVSITENKNFQLGWRIGPRFQLTQHERNKALLEGIKNSLRVGQIYKGGPQSLQFKVSVFLELQKFLYHFAKYPLLTKKRADFLLLMLVIELIERREHLTLEGLHKILAIRASMNRGLSEKLKSAFPDVVPVVRPLVENPQILDPNWLAGFTTGEGSFIVNIKASQTHSIGFQVLLVFELTQHMRDERLMRSLIELL